MYPYFLVMVFSYVLLFPNFFVNLLEVLVVSVLIPFLNWYNVNKHSIQISYVNHFKQDDEEQDDEEQDDEEKDDEEKDDEEQDDEEQDDEECKDEQEETVDKEVTSDEKEEKTSLNTLHKVPSCKTTCDCVEQEKEVKYCDIKCANYVDCECKQFLSKLPNLPDSPSKNVPFYVEYELD